MVDGTILGSFWVLEFFLEVVEGLVSNSDK
jgi:hypothetical protein